MSRRIIIPCHNVLKSAKLDACGQRWAAALGDYNFDIHYKPVKNLRDVDALSSIREDTWKKMISSTVHAVCQGQLVSDFASVYCFSLPQEVYLNTSVTGHFDINTWLEEQSEDPDVMEVLVVSLYCFVETVLQITN